jgi:hypothetical protein
VSRQRSGRDKAITIYVTPVLKSTLEAEAWECERTLSEYCRGLLERRGKWTRSIGTAGNYDIMTSADDLPRVEDEDKPTGEE